MMGSGQMGVTHHKNTRYKEPLSKTDPHLCTEWDFAKNSPAFAPDTVTRGSDKKVWWVCSVCGHSWVSTINHRVVGRGCPACSKRAPTPTDNLAVAAPEVVLDWDYTLNAKSPGCYRPQSGKYVMWKCHRCGFSWRARIQDRFKYRAGCPKCTGAIVHEKNCLSYTHPDIAAELVGPQCSQQIRAGSHATVQWKCRRCALVWSTNVKNRTRGGTGCPYCSGRYPTAADNLLSRFPALAAQWHPTRNGSVIPEKVKSGSDKKRWWLCEACGYEWEASPNSRTSGAVVGGCPLCSRGCISKVSQKWLDFLAAPQENREVWLLCCGKKYRVDAFDPQTNTVYEFLGDYWHGNPRTQNKEGVNHVNGKTFGRLYEEVLARFKILRETGFTVKYVWESDYKKGLLFSND